jgi:hypothetical protein
MTWTEAVAWADQLNFAGYSDWRLPKTLLPDATCEVDQRVGYGCSGSELGHLYHVEFGAVGDSSALDSGDPDLALFINLQSDSYWSATSTTLKGGCGSCDYAYKFELHHGKQDIEDVPSDLHAIAVRDGDVSPVPLPAAVWLLLSGLGAMGLLGRRRSPKGRSD